MAHRPGASRLARLTVSATLAVAALGGSSAAAETSPVCHHPNGPRCVAAQRAQRTAARAAHRAAVRVAPTLSADGTTLSWSAVPGVETYVLIRIVPGKPRERHVVTGTSFTPHETHGVTAEYLVRTHVARSHWSAPVSIAYAPKASHRRRDSEEGGSGNPPGSGSGNPPGSTPGTPPGSTPGTPPGSTPGTPPGSTPGTPPGSTPGNPPGSSSGSGSGSEAGGSQPVPSPVPPVPAEQVPAGQ